MKSKASLNGHPIHPILVSFPIAFLTGTLVFDLMWKFTGNNSLWQTAYYLEIAGIGTGLLAAIPGIIDFLFTVPPKSSGKKRAAKHGVVNVTQIILFFIALMMRRNDAAGMNVVILLELLGTILIVIAGWLGGTLVYRNQIGVDPRYAQAGKWKEEYVDAKSGKIKVGSADELQVNQMKLIHIDKKRIVIGRTENGYVAFDDHCTHKGGSLAGGSMICGMVQCPWHGSQFDLATGQVKSGPAQQDIKTYSLLENNGSVFLELI